MKKDRANSLSRDIKVCLVTEELAGIGGSGGIGAAFLELAQLLATSGASVDVLYCPVSGTVTDEERLTLVNKFRSVGIKLRFLDAAAYVTEPLTYEKKSYAVARTLCASPHQYAFIHFHDYKGLGYFATSLKRQGLGFLESELIVQLHGPTRWTIDANNAFFIHEDQLKIDFMERMSIAQADRAVSPSAYLVDWLRENDFTLPSQVNVIKNVCSEMGGLLKQFRWRAAEEGQAPTDIVLFARHEERKGFTVFCDALDLLHDELVARRITVSFVGKLGMVGAEPSGAYLIDRAKKWKFQIKVRTGLDRNGAAMYIASRSRPLVVIPSPGENSPYTVLESIMLGIPVISSLRGGGRELFEDAAYPGLCDITAAGLAMAMGRALKQGLPVPMPSESAREIERHWIELHSRPPVALHSVVTGTEVKPKVTFAITHYERPRKLIDAVLSAVRQTYSNIEIIVVDDGSASEMTLAELQKIERILTRIGGRLIRRENGYLGAARNTAIQAAQGEFICFLDDDDIAFPDLVETLVQAAVCSGSDIVNCMNVFMDESLRGEALSGSAKAPTKVSFIPLGGPLALAPTENCLGAATALFRKKALLDVGGYTELKGVGYEDYELFIRMTQAGKRLTVVPSPLYFYEVGRPSMISQTSMVTNFRRCFDALDARLNSSAWRDLISLNVGKHTSVHGHNRQWWVYSQTKTATLRHSLFDKALDRLATLQCLSDIAAAEGVERLRIAFVEDAKQESLPVSEEDYVLFDDISIDAAQGSSAPVGDDGPLLDARLDLALGRNEDAVRALCAYVTATGVVRGNVVAVIKQLLNDPGRGHVAPVAWRTLANALREAKLSRDAFSELNVSMSYLNMLAQDAQAVLASVLPQLDRLEKDYLARHQDVAMAVGKRQFTSGLDHYLSFGMQEGRNGFEALHGIMEFSLTAPATNELAEKVLAVARSSITKCFTEAKSAS